MSLLKALLFSQRVGAGKPPTIFPMEYIFTEGTASPYNVKYDDLVGSGPYAVATSEDINVTTLNSQRKLVRQSDGTLYAVYRKELAGEWQIYVKKSVDEGENWTDETRVSVNAAKHMEDYGQNVPAIAVDSDDNLHVVWNGLDDDYPARNQIWYVKYTDSWSTPLRISTETITYVALAASIAIDSNDYIHSVYIAKTTTHMTYYQVWYVKYDGSWSAPLRISTLAEMENNANGYATIEIDSSDDLHVGFLGNIGTPAGQYVYYTKYDGSWSAPLVLSSVATTIVPSIAIDSDDHTHIVYTAVVGADTHGQVYYRKYDGSWSAELRISDAAGMENFDQPDPTIAVDSGDNLHVLWFGKATGHVDEDKVWHAEYTDSWATPEVLQPTGKNQNPSLRWSRWP